MVAPVGGMQVDEDVGIPRRQQRVRRPGLRGLELHVVAVEVEPLAVQARADHRGTVLAGPVALAGAELLVAVDVVDRHHEHDHAVEQAAERPDRQVAQQHLRGLFALHLAAVDVALDVDDGLAAARRGGRPLDHRPRREHPRDGPPLRAGAENPQAQVTGAARQRIEEAGHVGVAGGLGPAGPLRSGGLRGEPGGSGQGQREGREWQGTQEVTGHGSRGTGQG